ncbi:hypothetical protein D6C84_08748 [Aureobasidium pullulans]|uniref:Zinc-ribbon 15 domain-containing protein n=2 Tax=Aureobasidium pullulans TaxID=5580 RepID=A0A074X7M7_AURPU|nr:uncharacterized protein M438DRAFT_279597 [Aureobasidium pullulans EXF-150]KAG2168252.1 hypothetical protein JADG_007991 [Aureobasidium pullulans]KEQ81525.1 hypothetical protein M438DRAFT_279597 [Aureobasidium pullulans EXF-150]THV67291.1 hypothetical protein D6D28_07598 [Aureobasidium pullulans]THV79642.1 hypothetical protein D6D29_06726 [Aureobasidium pullulans]THW10173.1 hypothetical protein D6D24_08172 [Aureobasidium pullulans]
MAFIFTCGTHTFNSLLAGHENITAQCQNCGNFTAKVYKRWEWFTFCFVPLIPFSLKPHHEVGCHICHFYQDVMHRPDVQQMMNDPNSANNPQSSQQIPMQPYGAPPQQYKAPQGPPQYV